MTSATKWRPVSELPQNFTGEVWTWDGSKVDAWMWDGMWCYHGFDPVLHDIHISHFQYMEYQDWEWDDKENFLGFEYHSDWMDANEPKPPRE
jgi:hypothetical protein